MDPVLSAFLLEPRTPQRPRAHLGQPRGSGQRPSLSAVLLGNIQTILPALKFGALETSAL